MKALTTLVITEFRLYLREPAAVFFTLVFPIMLLVIFGSIFGNDPDDGSGGWGPLDLTAQGYFAMVIGTVTLLGIPIVVASYRQHGIFRRMRATPLQPVTIILAHTVVNLIMTALGLIVLIVAGVLLYDLRLPEDAWGVTVGTLVGYCSFAAIGFLIGGIAQTSRTAQVIGNVIYFPQLFLAGAALPREMFSERLRQWTEWLPMTQVVNVIKAPWQGDGVDLLAVAVLLALGAAAILVSSRLFRWE